MSTILVVDDSPTVVAFARKVLGAQGFEVVGLSSFDELRETLEKHRPDAILLDLEMPPHTGREAAEVIRRSGSDVPIVVYSARPAQELRAASYVVGAHSYLRKGGDPAELLYVVRSAVARASLAPPAR